LYKVLIIGLGKIGMGYDINNNSTKDILSHSKAFNEHKNFKLIGGVDPDKNKCNLFSLTFGCHSYTSLDDALANNKPDIFVVSTPTELHYDTINNILSKFIPTAILCEKPISYSLKEAKKIIQLCKKLKCKLYINYMRRSDVGVQEIVKRINKNLIIPPAKGIVFYSKGIYNSASHFINLLQYLFGKPVYCKNYHFNHNKIDVDPDLDFQIKFQNANVMFLGIDKKHYFYNSMDLFFSNGRLKYESGGEKILWYRINQIKNNLLDNTLSLKSEVFKSDFKRMQFNLVEEMAKNLNNSPSNICSGCEGLETLKIIEKVKVFS
jgi:predicted dehydrogenase